MKSKSRTKFIILGMLSLKSLSGYEIIKMIQSSTNHFWSESEGQIYPALNQCVKDGFATCKEEKSKKTQRTKKIYSITTKGKNEFVTWLKKSPQTTLIRNEFLLKIFFGGYIDDRDNIYHIVKRQKELQSELELYEKVRCEIIKEHENSPQLKYWLMSLDYGIKTSKAELTWCKDTLKILESS